MGIAQKDISTMYTESIPCDTPDDYCRIVGDILSKEQVQDILSRYTKTEGANLLSFSVSHFSNHLDGVLGEQFLLRLAYKEANKEKQVQFFVKIITRDNPIMNKIIKEILGFEKEAFFYNKFVPYLKAENVNCDYVPKSYFCESETIVLEDLRLSSYQISGKNIPLDLEHCKISLKYIARFHADSILFELKKSKELSREYKLSQAFSDIFEDKMFTDPNTQMTRYYNSSIKGLCQLIDLIPENKIKSPDFKNAFMTALESLSAIEDQAKNKFRLTITHNDLWSNNILYKYGKNREILSCKIIDFQTISLKPPITDALGFLFMNTKQRFRDKYLTELLAHYYTCFSEYLEQNGYNSKDILSVEEFWDSYDFLKLSIKITSTVDRSFTMIPEEIYFRSLKSEEAFSKFIFENRGDVMSEVFKTDNHYRTLISEDLCEIRSILFVK